MISINTSQQKTSRMVPCPTCKAKIEWTEKNTYRPFCSERCRNTDFVAWANEENIMEGSSVYNDLLSGDLDGAFDE